MATRIKTVEFAFQSRNTSLTANTRYDFSAITLYLPENSTRTFRSVRLVIFHRDNVTTATSIGNVLMGIKLGAAAFSDVDPIATTPSNSGENQFFIWERDVTSYFTSNFGSGTSQTCQVGFRAVGAATINIGAKLIITYEYDDADTTHVKTVKIPLDSGTGALTATLAEIGTNQIPNLDSFLPETSKVYRNIWFELMYNEATVGTANDASLGMQVDSGTEHLTGVHESGLASSPFGWYLWDQGASPAWSTGSAHAFKLRSSTITTASTFNHVSIVLCVSYEFDPDSTSIINSLELILPQKSHVAAAAADAERSWINLWIEEPGTITMVQSGAVVHYNQTGTNSPTFKIGAGTARTYTDAAVLTCGGFTFSQRCDSGGAGGSGFTLARGKNILYADTYIASGNVSPGAFSISLILNYTSDNDGNGGSRHNHTLAFNIQNSQTTVTNLVYSAGGAIFLPDTDGWFVNNFGIYNRGSHSATSVQALVLRVEAGSGELGGDNFYELACIDSTCDSELGWYIEGYNIDNLHPNYYDRWKDDPQTTRMALTTARRFSHHSVIHANLSLSYLLTKHSIVFPIAGTISGSSAGTVNIDAYSDTFGLIGSTSRSGNGAYSIPWYDDTEAVKVYARESSTLVGASDEAVVA